MGLISDIQLLEPGSEVYLFEIDGEQWGAGITRFHGHNFPYTAQEIQNAGGSVDQLPAKSIWWQGNEYYAWPVDADGFGSNSDGTAVRPTFSLGDVNGRITAVCLKFQDMIGFSLTVRMTLKKYLDERNFPDGNPTADPTEEALEVWYLDQKTSEDGEVVTWDLASPGDVGGEDIGRQMMQLCSWAMSGGYRGPSCQYTGPYYDIDGNPTNNPELDKCNGCLSTGCVVRFGKGNPLPFGGFPAISLVPRS